MSRSAEIVLTWADGDYPFALRWGQLIELQEKQDAGPYFILSRLLDGTWRVGDIGEVIRLGLIGGGMEPIKALRLVRTYVEARPPLENMAAAQAILGAALMGAEDEEIVRPRDRSQDDRELPPRGKIRFADIFGAGAAIGLSPAEVKACSVWEFEAAIAGYVSAHGAEDDKRLSSNEAADLWTGVMERMH